MKTRREKIRALLLQIDRAQRSQIGAPMSDEELYVILAALIDVNNARGRAHLPENARRILAILDDADERSIAAGNDQLVTRWAIGDELAALDEQIAREEATLSVRQRHGYEGGAQADQLVELRRRRVELAQATT